MPTGYCLHVVAENVHLAELFSIFKFSNTTQKQSPKAPKERTFFADTFCNTKAVCFALLSHSIGIWSLHILKIFFRGFAVYFCSNASHLENIFHIQHFAPSPYQHISPSHLFWLPNHSQKFFFVFLSFQAATEMLNSNDFLLFGVRIQRNFFKSTTTGLQKWHLTMRSFRSTPAACLGACWSYHCSVCALRWFGDLQKK